MTREELKYIQKELGYTIQQMADSINIPKNTYEKWLYGVSPIPEAYEKILRGMYISVRKKKSDELKTAISLGLAGLGFFALGMLLEKDNDNEPSEVYDAD